MFYRSLSGKSLIALALCVITANFPQSITFAQSSRIQGVVLHADEKTPLAGVQVFFDGTTNGTLTNADGSFILEYDPDNVQVLVARFLGFKKVLIGIASLDPERDLIIRMEEEVYELDEITVTPDPGERAYQLGEFERAVIGTGPFSQKTSLQNDEVLTFYYEVGNGVNQLTARASEPLVFSNEALGYRITFSMDRFIVDYKNDISFFAGQTFFEPMNARRKRKQNRWQRNRETAYNGSFMHFVRSVLDGSTREAGYLVRREDRRNGKRYVSQQTLSEEEFFGPLNADSSTQGFLIPHLLNVTFTGEKEDPRYLEHIRSFRDRNPRKVTGFQHSVLIGVTDSVAVRTSGTLENPGDLFFEGYWGFEKLSDMLPTDYTGKL